MSAVVERECRGDFVAIGDVVRRAFHDHQSVADLVELIRASPHYVPELALVARAGPDVVGFVMLSHVAVAAGDGARHDVLTLSPLAVAPDHERQGIGSTLVRAGLAAADATGAGLVTLEGSPAYYGRLGLQFAPDFGITIDLPKWAHGRRPRCTPCRHTTRRCAASWSTPQRSLLSTEVIKSVLARAAVRSRWRGSASGLALLLSGPMAGRPRRSVNVPPPPLVPLDVRHVVADQ